MLAKEAGWQGGRDDLGSVNGPGEGTLGGEAHLGRTRPAAPRRGGRRDSTRRSRRSASLFKRRRAINQNRIGLGVPACRVGGRRSSPGHAKPRGSVRNRRKLRRGARAGPRTHFRRRPGWGAKGPVGVGRPPPPGLGKTGGKRAGRRCLGPRSGLDAGGRRRLLVRPVLEAPAGSPQVWDWAATVPGSAGLPRRPSSDWRARTFRRPGLLGHGC